MVRRSTVDRSPQPGVHDAGYDTVAADAAPAVGRASRGWGGAGGRWLVWI